MKLFSDALRTALASIGAAKARAALTMLGVVIGVFAVSTLIAVGEGVRRQAEQLIVGLGPDLLAILPGASPQGGLPAATQLGATSALTTGDVAALRSLPAIREVQAMMFIGRIVSYRGRQTVPFLIGGTVGIERFFKLQPTFGRSLSAQDSNVGGRVVVFGSAAADQLGLTRRPLPATVLIGKEPFTVVGYFAKSDQLSLGLNIDTTVIIPLPTAEALTHSDRVHRIWAFSRDPRNLAAAKAQIKTLLLDRHGEEDFSILEQREVLSLLDRILTIMTALVSGLAAISLLVGGVGIMNIMLVSVTERTREIGLRKAVGATTGAILAQFLIEAAVLSLLGSAVGVALAWVATRLAAIYSPLQPIMTPQALGLATAVGIVIGILFGLVPAVRAATKNPIDALRYE
ncbi:MAG TPA: ABC transporter permease [bacterium]